MLDFSHSPQRIEWDYFDLLSLTVSLCACADDCESIAHVTLLIFFRLIVGNYKILRIVPAERTWAEVVVSNLLSGKIGDWHRLY